MLIGIDFSILHSYEGTQIMAENLVGSLINDHPEHSYIIYKPAEFLPNFFSLPRQYSNVKVIILGAAASSLKRLWRQQVELPFRILKDRPEVLVSFSPFFSWLAP